MISTAEEAREVAFRYWTSHYGNLIQIGKPVYADGYYAFPLYSNYPLWDEDELESTGLLKCEHLGEIVVHIDGSIVSATPREIVVKRLNKYLEAYEESLGE